MDISIVGRHTKVGDEFRDRILEKLRKVPELHPKATHVDVHVVHERNPKISTERERVELTLHVRGNVIRAEAAAADRVDALDSAAQRLTEQLRRMHERHAHRHQGKPSVRSLPVDQASVEAIAADERVASVETWEGAPPEHVREVPIDGTPIVIRSKTHEAAPMTVTEAIDAMELVGHDFYLFRDVDTGMASAVYRRRGWTYGVIQLDEQADSTSTVAQDAVRASA